MKISLLLCVFYSCVGFSGDWYSFGNEGEVFDEGYSWNSEADSATEQFIDNLFADPLESPPIPQDELAIFDNLPAKPVYASETPRAQVVSPQPQPQPQPQSGRKLTPNDFLKRMNDDTVRPAFRPQKKFPAIVPEKQDSQKRSRSMSAVAGISDSKRPLVFDAMILCAYLGEGAERPKPAPDLTYSIILNNLRDLLDCVKKKYGGEREIYDAARITLLKMYFSNWPTGREKNAQIWQGTLRPNLLVIHSKTAEIIGSQRVQWLLYKWDESLQVDPDEPARKCQKTAVNS